MDIRFLFLSAAISSLAITPAVAQAATCDDPIIAQKIFDRRAKKGPMPTAHARIINIQLGADDLSRVQQDLGESEPLARH